MAGAAAGGDAGRGGNHAALRGILRELVEVRRRGGFERREVILFLRRDVAETVEDDQRELGFGLQCQFRIKCVQIHPHSLGKPRRDAIRFIGISRPLMMILRKLNQSFVTNPWGGTRAAPALGHPPRLLLGDGLGAQPLQHLRRLRPVGEHAHD